MKRIHLKQQPPEIHGMIAEHMASHSHKSMEDTVSCLITEAMKRIDDVDKHEDQKKLIEFYISENDRLKTSLNASRVLNDSLNLIIKKLLDEKSMLTDKVNMADADGNP